MARRRSIIPGLSFSWKRALGLTSAKRKFARYTGIPTTRSGRQRKAARMIGCTGCLVWILGGIVALSIIAFLLV